MTTYVPLNCGLYREVIQCSLSIVTAILIVAFIDRCLCLYSIVQGSAQDYLEVVKMGLDKHTYNIFQSNNNIKCIVVVWSLNDKDL